MIHQRIKFSYILLYKCNTFLWERLGWVQLHTSVLPPPPVSLWKMTESCHIKTVTKIPRCFTTTWSRWCPNYIDRNKRREMKLPEATWLVWGYLALELGFVIFQTRTLETTIGNVRIHPSKHGISCLFLCCPFYIAFLCTHSSVSSVIDLSTLERMTTVIWKSTFQMESFGTRILRLNRIYYRPQSDPEQPTHLLVLDSIYVM